MSRFQTCMICGQRRPFRRHVVVDCVPMHWLCANLNWPFRLYADPWPPPRPVPSWVWSWAAFLLVAGVVMGLQYLFRGGLSGP